MTEFFEKWMGNRFYEHTLPELVRQVARLADAVERIADLRVQGGSEPKPTKGKQDDREDEGSPKH